MNNHFSDAILIWDFFMTFKDIFSITLDFSPQQLYQALLTNKPSYLLETLIVNSFYTLLDSPSFQSNSNFLNLINQISSCSKFLKKVVLTQTWPICLKQLQKVPRIKPETQNQEFEEAIQIISRQNFFEVDIGQRIKVYHNIFNKQKIFYQIIELLGYEQEYFQKEISIREEMKEEVNLKFSLGREQEKIIRQQSKVQKEIDEEKRKRRKDKKKLEELTNQADDFQERIVYYERLQSIRDEDGGAEFLLTGAYKIYSNETQEYYVFKKQFDKMYLRTISNDQWTILEKEVNCYQLLKFMQKMNDAVSQLLQEKKCTTRIKNIQKKGYLDNQAEIQDSINHIESEGDIDKLIENKFNLEFIQKCENEEELMNRTKQILIALENDYSEYELVYWKCCWASKEKREQWRNKVLTCNEKDELQAIIKKIPHQLSFANKKHGLSQEELDENVKFKSFRCRIYVKSIQLVYWFYQNRQYCYAYTSLAKLDGDSYISYILVISLYEKLKQFMQKKINQLQLKPVEQQQPSQQPSQQQLEFQLDSTESHSVVRDKKPDSPQKRLRSRKSKINYKEIEEEQNNQTESTSKKKDKEKVLENEKRYEQICQIYGLRPRKQLKY